MRYENNILNEAIADKKKFYDIFIMAVKLMNNSYRDEYSFYTEEALELYKEMSPVLIQMGYSYDMHIDQPGFRMTLLHIMSIVWMLQEKDKNSDHIPEVREFEGDNVIDFFKYKNKSNGNNITALKNTRA